MLAGDRSGRCRRRRLGAADTLHAAAAALGSRVLRQAADAYDRAARAPYGRIPAPTPAGDSLRRAARLLSAYAYITSDPSFRPLVLIVRLAALAEAVACLRQTQQHAAQAASALRAAEQLHSRQRVLCHTGRSQPALRAVGSHAGRRRIPGTSWPGPGRAIHSGTIGAANPAAGTTQPRAAAPTPLKRRPPRRT